MQCNVSGACLVFLLAFGAHAAVAKAQPFYEGRQINLIVGGGAGGGYDAYARLLARHWPRFIPGTPGMVVQNMPAAGSLVAMNTLANSAPRDGTTIAAVQTHIGVEPIMGVTGSLDNVKFDSRQMSWIGSAAKEYPLIVLWHTSPFNSFKDLLVRESTVGSRGPATSDSDYARIMNELMGTKFRVIEGYKDNPEMIAASERGEIMGRAGWFLGSLFSTQRQVYEQGKWKILAQVAFDKHPELPNVPIVTELLADETKRRQLEFSLAWLPMGRPYVAPPGVPADRVEILRASFLEALASPELQGEAKRMGIEVSPMAGRDIQALLERLYATPKDTVDRVRTIMLSTGK